LGKRVKKGQVLGTLHLRIHRQFFTETETPIIAPFTGVVIGYTENPMVYQGEALVHLAKIGNTKK
jgi:predicted deacylase